MRSVRSCFAFNGESSTDLLVKAFIKLGTLKRDMRMQKILIQRLGHGKQRRYMIFCLFIASMLFKNLPAFAEAPPQSLVGQMVPAESRAMPEEATEPVTLSWPPIEGASEYLLEIAYDDDFDRIVMRTRTERSAYQTPSLKVGSYYYRVTGIFDGEVRGRLDPQTFAVTKPLEITSGQKPRLPAPEITSPKHMELFPSRGTVRLSWKKVDGAKSYRVRLWDFEGYAGTGGRSLPRWETKTNQNFLEINDAPYSSFMFLESGRYRYDIAAINENSLGYDAIGFFEVDRSWFLKPSETYVRLATGGSPYTRLYSTDVGGQNARRPRAYSARLALELDHWMLRRWGVYLAGHGDYVWNRVVDGSAIVSSGFLLSETRFGLQHRVHLASTPDGFDFMAALGFGTFEIVDVSIIRESVEDTIRRRANLGRVMAFSVDAQLGLLYRTMGSWVWSGRALLRNPFIYRGYQVRDQAEFLYRPSYTLAARATHLLGPPGRSHVNMFVDLGIDRRHFEYKFPSDSGQASMQHTQWNVLIGFEFNLFHTPSDDFERGQAFYGSTKAESQRWRRR